jgi:methionyl-tRNA formyltransferase
LKLAFAGTPEFARVALNALHRAGHDIVLVLTQPDRPAGRGMKLQASPVKLWAREQGVALIQPHSLRLDGKFAAEAQAAQASLQAARPELMVVAAYGLILPAWTLALPARGCLNIHGSLLPRWRGAAPIQRAIEAGDAQTGITLMQMDAGLDTGAMLLEAPLAIHSTDTAALLHERLAELGAQVVVRGLELLAQGRLAPKAQPPEGVSYAAKIEKREAAIDWTQDAALIERRTRAFDPFPGCSFEWQGQTLKLWRAQVVDAQGVPGTRLESPAERLVVACGVGALELLEIQAPGGRRVAVRDGLARQLG